MPLFCFNPNGTPCTRQPTLSLLYELRRKVLRPAGYWPLEVETEYGSLRPRRALFYAASVRTSRCHAPFPVAAFYICAGYAGEWGCASCSQSAPVVLRGTPLHGHEGESVSRMRTGASLQLTPAAAVTGRAVRMVELPPADARAPEDPCPWGASTVLP